MDDPFDLARCLDARAPECAQVLTELRAGRKRSHWMWFIFPQRVGWAAAVLRSSTGSAVGAEARAYLDEATLGTRLRECARIVSSVLGRSVELLLGSVDAQKLRSSMTLFEEVAGETGEDFAAVLDGCFAGQRDSVILALLSER